MRRWKPLRLVRRSSGFVGARLEGRMKTMVNLLPSSFRRRQMLQRRIVQWTSLMCAVLAIGWTWHWYEMREYCSLSQQLDTLSREHAPTQKMLQELVAMRQQLVDLQKQEGVA